MCSFASEEEHAYELSQKFRIHPQSRRLVWSPSDDYIMILSHDGTILVLTNTCDLVGTIESAELSDDKGSKVQYLLPFQSDTPTPSDTHTFNLHIVFSTGDVATARLCLKHTHTPKGNSIQIEVYCRYKLYMTRNGRRDSIDAAVFLPRRSLLLVVSALTHRTRHLQCLWYNEKNSSLEAIPDGSTDMSLKCAYPLVEPAPFLDISVDPTER